MRWDQIYKDCFNGKIMKNAIILCSGGLDSVVTAYYVKKKLRYDKLIFLFFDYGQRTLEVERKASKRFAEMLRAGFVEVKLNWLGKISTSLINSNKKAKKISRKGLKDSKKESLNFYVPNRNAVFLNNAIAFAESLVINGRGFSDIFVGFNSEGVEAYPDTTPEFVDNMNGLMKIMRLKGKIIAPLIEMDKNDIVSLGNELGVKMENSFSCYVGGKKHCGVCLGCRLRQEAFYWANVKDKTKYKERMGDYRGA